MEGLDEAGWSEKSEFFEHKRKKEIYLKGKGEGFWQGKDGERSVSYLIITTNKNFTMYTSVHRRTIYSSQGLETA